MYACLTAVTTYAPIARLRNSRSNPAMSQNLKIAVYPGDGIGPEVIDEAIRVLERTAELDRGFSLALTSFPWGVEHWKRHGKVVPDNFLEVLRPFDAILLGAVGWPELLSDGETLAPLVKIRQ